MSHDEVIKEIAKTKTLWHKLKTLNGIETTAMLIGIWLMWIYIVEPVFEGITQGLGYTSSEIHLLRQEFEDYKKLNELKFQEQPTGRLIREIR